MLDEFLKLGLKQIWAHKLRSFLTVLSITIGVASIVAMTSLAESGLMTLTRGVEDIGGTRFIWIIPDQPKQAKGKTDAYPRGLTWGDRLALAARIPSIESIVASRRSYNDTVETAGQPPAVATVLLTEAGYFKAYKMGIGEGRPLEDADRREGRRVMVIGGLLSKRLFPAGQALGKEVAFQGGRYKVVGVLSPNLKNGVKLGFDWDRIAIVPLMPAGPDGEVEEISVTVKKTEDGERAIRVANALLLHRHNGVDNFQFLDFAGLLKNFFLAFSIMKLVVALISGVALMIGGVGVMNIMLVSVNERMREIGLRKALGATEGVILTQFLIEAVMLSLVGAVVGVATGWVAVKGATAVIMQLATGWVPSFSMTAVVAGVVAAFAVGVFFGWYPAKRAAQLDPILCLRHE